MDLAIQGFDPLREDEQTIGTGGAGLVASVNPPTLHRLQKLAGDRFPYVVGAHDAGTALGLAIVTQPDVAIIDERLDLANGADLAVVLPMYAPRTKPLLLTDDAEEAARAQLTDVAVRTREVSDQELLSWMSTAVGSRQSH